MAWEVLLSPDGGLTLLAPLVAIGSALVTKKVLPSLFAGAVVGALVARDGDPVGAIHALATYLAEALGFERTAPSAADLHGWQTHANAILQRVIVTDEPWVWEFSWNHLTISAFSLLVAGTVGVMTASGGTRALVQSLEGVAKGPRGAMVASWLAGVVVFFDDYANCLVVGNTMGPLCDRFRVSRAKLSYIVDSTAAPVATLAVVSTWTGYQVGLVDDALDAAGSGASAFGVFLHSIPFAFYSFCTIAFVGSVALTGRDFGPMAASERTARAKSPPALDAARASAHGVWLAAVPVVALVGVTLAALVYSGRTNLGADASNASFYQVLGEADPYRSMLGGALTAIGIASGLAIAAGRLTFAGAFRAAWNSMRAVGEALLVLYLAWTLGGAVEDSGAAGFLAGALDGTLPPALLPAVTYLLAAAISFATGTSFGTMSMLIPLAVPLALALSGGQEGMLLYASTAAVLSGACFGDHSSPISDTTVLSALGSNVDLLTHVETQLPYAIWAGLAALVTGFLPVGFGVSAWILVPLGAVACVGVVMGLGTNSGD